MTKGTQRYYVCTIFLVFIFFMGGCAGVSSVSGNENIKPAAGRYLCFHIISQPPGAAIDIDGHYEGQAPFVWMAPKEKYDSKPLVILAHPLTSAEATQRRVFFNLNEIPQELHFDLAQPH